MTTDDWWMLKDPADVLRQALADTHPEEGDIVVVRVAADSQAITGITVLDVPPGPPHDADKEEEGRYRMSLSDLACEAATELAPPYVWNDQGRGGLTGFFITLVCRQGRVVTTAAEWTWINAWRYANHFRDGFDSDVYAVTPHGWTGVMDRRSGFLPALTVSAPQRRWNGRSCPTTMD